MKSLFENFTNHREAKKRTIALALLICFISISLLSRVFILTHANHMHDHNDTAATCITCSQIQNAENILKQLGTLTTKSFIILAGLYVAASIIKTMSFDITLLTPVTSKIRMNN